MNENKEPLDASITEKIQNGQVRMKSKYVFLRTSVLLLIAMGFLFLISSWMVSILVYKFRSHQLWEYMSYGKPGVQAFWHNIPLGAILLAILTFAGGMVLLKKFDICYKRNFILILSIFILMILSIAFITEYKGINKILDHEKYMKNIYHNQFINPDWIIGTVIHRDPKGYYVRNVDGRFFRAVPVNSATQLPIINRSECLKAKGIITDEYTIKTYNLYKCHYKFTR